MKRRATGSLLIAGGVLSALIAVAARADESPLLVVVEAPSELAVDAGEIRRAIGTELHGATVAPARPASDSSDRALIVSVERERITMSLRDSAASPVTRVMPSPVERAARVRAIAWLAGNLARDQVSGIVAETPAPLPPPASTPEMPPTNTASAAPAASAPAYATEPPPYQPIAAPVLAVHSDQPPGSSSRWFLSLEAGPVVGAYDALAGAASPFASLVSTLWRVELRHLSADHRFMLGASLEGTTGGSWFPAPTGRGAALDHYDPETLGVAGECGWSRHLGRWTMDETLGIGLDLGHRVSESSGTTTTASESSTTGFTTSTTITTGGLGVGVFGMAALAFSHPVTEDASLFLRLGAHVSTVEPDDIFIWTALGLSYGIL